MTDSGGRLLPLESATIPYAVCGGHAVAEWMTRAYQGGVRNTPDVNILLRRADFDAAKSAMEVAGFVYRHAASIDMFLDGPGDRARDASTSCSRTRRCETTTRCRRPT